MRILSLILVLAACLSCSTAVIAAEPMKLTSPDIREGDHMHHKFTCQGINISPALEFIDVPENTKSMAITMHDPDAPSGDWTHWLVYNIPPENREFSQGWIYGIEGKNDFGENGWKGPCPPYGQHRYIFKGYALDRMLALPRGALRQEVEDAIQGNIIDTATLTAVYERI